MGGNRTNTGYSTGTNNRLLSDGVYDYLYDDEGNRTKKTEIATGEATAYQWDHRNRLVKVTHLDSGGTPTQTLDYKYDIFDRRIGRSDTPVVGPAYLEDYVYDGEHLALEFEAGALANRYLHGPVIDQILADEQVDSLTSPGDVLWPLTDNLGTVRDLASHDAATDTTTIANHISYNAFGGITAETNAAVDHLFGYTGREWDAEADLQYNRARWYDPAVGRWVNQDPIGFEAGDENLYRYVGNGPTMATDPSGLWGWDDDWIELGFFGLIGYHGEDVATAAGVSIINNPARRTLDRLSIVDPTPLSGGTSAVLSGVIEGQSATEIGGNVLLEVLPGPSPKKATTTVAAAQHGFSHAPRGTRFPGNDVTKALDGFEWRGKPGSKPGSKEGNFYNPETGESLRPDLNHLDPIGPHWDYRDPDGKWWRIFPDGSMELK